MRKLKLQVQMTIDGFIAGKEGEMGWMTYPWTNDLLKYVAELTEPVDCILLGKNLAEGFIPTWKERLTDPMGEDPNFIRKMNDTHKVVFTKTLHTSPWENAVVANGHLAEEVNKVKQQEGKDIIVYGGGQFVSSLIKENLIDEFYFFINPAIIGKGMPIFQSISEQINYSLESSQQFDCGIIVLKYVPKR
jgi:dihydrofolate reductase